jgi:transcriptional regulator with XRE-family HTH domain
VPKIKQPNFSKEEIRNLIKRLRKKLGLSQEYLAKRLNKQQSYISKCESGEKNIDLVELSKICYALEIKLSLFVIKLEKK